MKSRMLVAGIAIVAVVACVAGYFIFRGGPAPSPSTPAASKTTPAKQPPAPTGTVAQTPPQTPPQPPPEVIPRFVPQKGNILVSDAGGIIESMTSEYGPGYTGNLLIDGNTTTSWKPRAVAFPQEIVFSFFNRQTALISSLVITAPAASAPKEVEVWTSTTSPTDGFAKIASQTLTGTGLDQTVTFPPVEAAFVKLRILSGIQPTALELQEVQIVEGQRDGYMPLAALHPDITEWKSSPRHAAQRGIEWLQAAAMDWQARNNCYGCHVQSQVMMGLAISKVGKYVVNEDCLQQLVKFVNANQNADGSISPNGAIVTATQFGAMGLAEFDKTNEVKSPVLVKSVDWILQKQQKTGEIPSDHTEPPIDQGMFMTTANSVTALFQAFTESGKTQYRQGALKGLAWIAANKPVTTQDEVFKILALSHFGNAQQKKGIDPIVKQLKSEQKEDGGWQEISTMKGSNAFATGQVLYAFKQASVAVDSPEFSRGVQFLLKNQKDTGDWPSMNSESGRPSEFAPTMWAVIGLAGSFREAECAEVERHPDKIIIRMCSRALFDFNHFDLKSDAQAVLDGIKKSLIDRYPGAPLQIEGYTDDIGTIPYNLTLSMNRAKSVAQWLQQGGIEPARMKPVGYGKAKPRYPNNSEENRARNRRVEIVITLKGDGAGGNN
jgi:outer membrane protein OmpA-like peptidoglycan-associated protein